MNVDINNMDSIRTYRFRLYPNNRCQSEIDARDTTQECSSCHNIKKGAERLTMNDRIYPLFLSCASITGV